MKFHLIQQTSNPAQSPVRVVEQTTGREVGWINRRSVDSVRSPSTMSPLVSARRRTYSRSR